MTEQVVEKPIETNNDENDDVIVSKLKKEDNAESRKLNQMKANQLISASQKVLPHLQKVGEFYDKVEPYFQLAYSKFLIAQEKFYEYQLNEALPVFIGFILTFFGGHFMVLIAAIEAYKMVGWRDTVNALYKLHDQFKKLMEENREDNKEDLDGDGIADVRQISPKQLLLRKTLLILRAVDPNVITTAFAALNAGFLAVIATLRMQFAQAITLGNALGDIFAKFAIVHLYPILETVCPAEYQKWITPVIRYFCKGVGVTIAWTIQRILSLVHSAIRGGTMMTRGLIVYLEKRKIIPDIDEGSMKFTIIGVAVAGLGIFFQLYYALTLPFPLNIILFPFTTTEWFLSHYVAETANLASVE